ncbi:MAG: hypothetical protein AAFQ45_12515 [Pseudomonadota bacterium]
MAPRTKPNPEPELRDGKLIVLNVNHPGNESRADPQKYADMRAAMLKVLPDAPPGLTQSEVFAAVKPHLPQATFPAGKASGWWAKTVQLDLEARGILKRTNKKPLTWYRA